MANNNLSRLDAVIEICGFSGISRVGSLDSSGSWPTKVYTSSSDACNAEEWLDRATTEFLSEGFDINTSLYTVTLGAPGTITLPDNTMSAKPIGKHQRRNISMRVIGGAGVAYDKDAATSTFAADTYTFEIIEDMDFATLDVRTQRKILAEAKRSFQMKAVGNQVKDAYLEAQATRTEVVAPRTTPPPSNQPSIDRPLVMQARGQ